MSDSRSSSCHYHCSAALSPAWPLLSSVLRCCIRTTTRLWACESITSLRDPRAQKHIQCSSRCVCTTACVCVVGDQVHLCAQQQPEAYTCTMHARPQDIPGVRDGTYVDRATFLVPKKKRDKINERLSSSAAKATSSGTGIFGRLWNGLMYACLHCHRSALVARCTVSSP